MLSADTFRPRRGPAVSHAAERRPVIFALIARALICVAVFGTSLASAATCAADVPSNDQILHAVQLESPEYFDSNGYSKIHIVNVKEPQPNWYVAFIHADGAGETGKIILRRDSPPNGALIVVAGPGTAFPGIVLPDAVHQAL